MGGIMQFAERARSRGGVSRVAAAMLSAIALTGCGSHFGETHYFSVLDNNQKPINFFRLTVSGGAGFANNRYVSGYFDERAVDLFLNESKSTPLPTDGTLGAVPPIFPKVDCTNMTPADCTAAQDKQLHLVPLGEKMPASGAFVLIISSNADAIAGTIGSFAENDITLNSAMYLLNHDKIMQAAKTNAVAPVAKATRKAVMDQVGAQLDSAGAVAADKRLTAYLDLLRTIGSGMSGDPPTFTDEASARAWFAAHRQAATQ
jgi:hypothetical protein